MDKRLKEVNFQISKAQKEKLYVICYNMRRRKLQLKWVISFYWRSISLVHIRKRGRDKFGPKFIDPFEVLEVVNNNLIIDVAGEMITVNLDQGRAYKF